MISSLFCIKYKPSTTIAGPANCSIFGLRTHTHTHAHEREREGGEGEGEEEGEGAESDRAISSAAADIIRLVEGRRFHRQRHRRFGEPRAVHRSGADSEVPYTAQ